MPFHYVRKTERASWSPEVMKNAVNACKQDGMSIRMAATRFNVPRSTLAHKVKLSAHDALPIRPPSLGRKPTLGLENEAELDHLILEVESRGFGLTKDDICCLAFEFAERNNIKHDFNKDTCKAGRFWMEGFLKRHPRIVPRKAEGLSKASARGMNKEVVGQYFDHLGAVVDREGLHQHPERINNVDETEHHSTSESDTESKLKEYICESSDKINSQVDDDGWIVDEPGQDLNECGENRQYSPMCTTSTSTGSTTDSKRPLSDDLNHEGSGKILNLGKSKCAESVNNGQWLSYQINKKRKHGIDLVTSSSSEEPGFPDSNVASDPSFSFKYISQIGSMCLSAHPQDSGRDGSHGGDKDRKTSDVSKNLPDVIPEQSQQKFKTTLDQLVKIADEATLAQTGACQAPSGYILKSFMYSPTKNMVTNQGREDPVEKQKPRPSERARILRRKPCNQPKPTGQPNNRTFLALIPVVPPQSTPDVTPIVETLKSTLDEKGKTDDLKVDENKRVTRSQVKQVPPKSNQAELQEAIAQGKPILNPLFPGPIFRRIAPKPNLPLPNPQDPTFSKPQASAPILGSIFELVPVKLPTSKILPENPTASTTARPFNLKTSSARRKQDPLSLQTRGEKWRQEESEMLIHESQEEGEEEQDQEVIHLIPDDEEGEVWEVVKMEI